MAPCEIVEKKIEGSERGIFRFASLGYYHCQHMFVLKNGIEVPVSKQTFDNFTKGDIYEYPEHRKYRGNVLILLLIAIGVVLILYPLLTYYLGR